MAMSLLHDTSASAAPADTTRPFDTSPPPAPETSPPPAPRSGWEFLTRSVRSQRCRDLAEHGYLIARTVPTAPAGAATGALATGRLREAIEGAVEISLALRGAVPPSVTGSSAADVTARDQLCRAKALGASGICLVLPELRLLGDGRVLDPRDGSALLVWKHLAEEEPVMLLFDDEDRELEIYLPVPIETLLTPPLPRIPGWPEDARSLDLDEERASDFDLDPEEIVLLEASDDGPLAEHQQWHRAAKAEPAPAAAAPAASPVEPDRPTIPDGAHRGALRHAGDDNATSVMRDDPLAGLEEDLAATAEPAQGSLFEGLFAAPTPSPSVAKSAPARKGAENKAPSVPRRRREIASKRRASEREQRTFDSAKLADHSARLIDARGARPVKQIEEQFVQHYVPLLEAIACGYDDREPERAVVGWRTAFEKSYGEGFAAMRMTGKRPRMVLDAPEEAIRVGKQNGARSVQLVLVDGMRYDLGLRVQAKLKKSLDRAACVEESLLWAALPSVTSVQMQLLAYGARGLRDLDPPSGSDDAVYREATATTMRRERIGQRDLLKLDVVEARLRDSGGRFDDRMDAISEEVSAAITKTAAELSPRTLLYVFGDHGFFMRNIGDDRTARAEQGGARPEEVLVGAFAWLIGDVH
jgi:hypothetical protein